MTGHFEDDQHALYCGWVLGQLVKAGYSPAPVMSGDDYTPKFEMPVNGELIEFSIGLPPEDWSLV